MFMLCVFPLLALYVQMSNDMLMKYILMLSTYRIHIVSYQIISCHKELLLELGLINKIKELSQTS